MLRRSGLPSISLVLNDFWMGYEDFLLLFFGCCSVAGRGNLNVVKGNYCFPTVHEINIPIIFS